MEGKTYTNKELAQDYFRVVAQYSVDSTAYSLQKRRIAVLTVDLPSFYREHGRSLEILQVKGIGKRTKGILELILDKGVEEAGKLIEEGKIEEMRKSAFRGVSRRVPRIREDIPPSWDNAVRRYEGD